MFCTSNFLNMQAGTIIWFHTNTANAQIWSCIVAMEQIKPNFFKIINIPSTNATRKKFIIQLESDSQ